MVANLSNTPSPRVARLIAAVILVSFASGLRAQSLTGLGQLPGGSSSASRGVSADGAVVVGDSGPAFGGVGFRWTAGGGMQSLGTLPGGTYSFVAGVSGNGLVISGYGDTTGGQQRAYRWTSSGGMEILGVLSGGTQSLGGGLSTDGSVIACISGSPSGYRAVRWTQAGGMENLGTLAGGAISFGYSISGDGAVVVGDGYSPVGDVAFRWTRGGGMQNLGALPGGTFSFAYAVSADGLVIVGDSDSLDGDVAYRWTAAGGMESLGLPSVAFDYMVSNAVSADGSAIVGSIIGADSVAFLWSAALGLVDLNTYLPTLGIDLTGWTLTDAGGISANGQTIVGTGIHNGVTEAWIARIGSTCPGDLNGDRTVNLGDIAQLLAHYGATPATPEQGDLNGDNRVDLSDLALILSVYGSVCP